MKKAILCLALCIGLFLPSFADYYAKEDDLTKVAGNKKLQEAVKLLKDFPANGSYKRILGKNPTNKPILVQFKNLNYLDPEYKNYDAIGWTTDNRLYIFINTKHKQAPTEALSALISNIAVHTDEEDSINEQIFACSLEAVVWNYFASKNPELRNVESELVKRENHIEELYKKSPEDVLYITSMIQDNSAYKNSKLESKGFSNDTFELKIERLFEVFTEIHEAK